MKTQPFETDLAGEWRLKLDPEDLGLREKWFLQELPASEPISLPGSLQEAGYGEKPGPDTLWTGAIKNKVLFSDPRYEPYRDPASFKVPFWLQPPRVYQGPCWYQRKIELNHASDWMEILLERCHWFTQAWIGDHDLGRGDSLSTPHTFRFQPMHSGEQLLTLRIDNRLLVDVGPNSHSVSDHTQTNWNGVIGEMRLRSGTGLHLDLLEIDAAPETGVVTVTLDVGSEAPLSESIEVEMRIVSSKNGASPCAESTTTLPPGESKVLSLVETLAVGPEVHAWSPHHPNVYELEVVIRCGEACLLRHRDSFGFVSMHTRGQEMYLNGNPIKLRGTLDCAIFPAHGYPPTEIEEWETIFTRIRGYGLNHVRFHSWCPPEAAFIAGDRTGLIFQVECGSWANTTSSVGSGAPIDTWLYEEGERIVRQFGNHPCFRLMAYGNEPGGPERGAAYLRPWVTHWKKRDPRRLHTSGAGWPAVPENDFHNLPEPRLQQWGEGLESQLNAKAPCTDFDLQPLLDDFPDRPVISHEIGQWCVYPDFDEIQKYTGVLKPCNLEIYRDFIEKKGLGPLAKHYHHASGRLQTYCYKAEIEAALRSKNLAGFQLLGLQDFSGQGTAPVGVLDAFWEPKDYVDEKEFRQFCGDTVLLASMERMTFREGESFTADISCSHFGEHDLSNTQVDWCLKTKTGTTLTSGALPISHLPTNRLSFLGTVSHIFTEEGNPDQLEFCVQLAGTDQRNTWSLFTYPKKVPPLDLENVIVAKEWQPHLATALKQGESVWLRLTPRDIDTEVLSGFSSIFWNTPWTRGQPPHTLGLLCDPDHPALSKFPTESFSDAQWWSILHHAAPLELDRIHWTDGGILSLVPDWNHPQPLSIAFEARVGKGRVLVTSIDFDAADDPALKQLEYSLMSYWVNAITDESPQITAGQLLTLLE